MSVSTEDLKARNATRWQNVVPTRDVSGIAKKLINYKYKYMKVQESTGVPWFVVAVIHQRESDQNFNTQLAQGDPLRHVSIHTPKGRGPFDNWEDGAYDALVNCPPFVSTWTDWTAAGTMTLLEHFNGLGYANRGIPSPYVWAGTNQYSRGKYVADGKFDTAAVDQQAGCAGLIISMRAQDHTILFADEKPIISEPEEAPEKTPIPPRIPPTAKAAGGLAAIAAAAWTFVKAHWIEITLISAVVGGLGYLAVRSYKNRKAKKNAENNMGQDQSPVPVDGTPVG